MRFLINIWTLPRRLLAARTGRPYENKWERAQRKTREKKRAMGNSPHRRNVG